METVTAEQALPGRAPEGGQPPARPPRAGARDAALGLIDRTGSGLEHFIFTGLDAAVAAEIGPLPSGRGVLGALIHDPRPLRLRDVAEHPDAIGFPPGHPPLRGFLGVPLLLPGAASGHP